MIESLQSTWFILWNFSWCKTYFELPPLGKRYDPVPKKNNKELIPSLIIIIIFYIKKIKKTHDTRFKLSLNPSEGIDLGFFMIRFYSLMFVVAWFRLVYHETHIREKENLLKN
jgi:hypothetical protein